MLCQYYNNVNKASSKNKHTNLCTYLEQTESTVRVASVASSVLRLLPVMTVMWQDAHNCDLQWCPVVCFLSLASSCCLQLAVGVGCVNSLHSSV